MKKTLLLILTLSFVCGPLAARELNNRERLVLSTYERTLEVFEYSIENIDESQLSWRDWGSYLLLKRSCRPVASKIQQIKDADSDYPDQSESLSTRYLTCSEGVLSLVKLYIQQR